MNKTTKPYVRFLGDIHGKLRRYVEITNEAEYSLCVGDVGFDYTYLSSKLDASKHKCVGGNHDNYTTEPCCKEGCEKCEGRGYTFSHLSLHFLKDYGVLEIPEFHPIFYVRGAWSIDKDYRQPGISWWPDEELTHQQCVNAITKYDELKPDFVVTHTVPESIIPNIPFEKIFGDKLYQNRTEQMLENMYQLHQPKRWIFGHWHKDWKKVIKHPVTGKETEFICLKELGYVDFEKI